MSSLAVQTRLILRNDLRLLWRDLMAGKLRAFSNLAVVGVLFALLNAASIILFLATRTQPSLAVETVVWFFFAFLMLGSAMNHAISVLFERADFDLLLSSPVAPRSILLARLATMTVGTAMGAVMFLLPLVNGAMIGVSRSYAWGYAVWLLLACTVASAGVWGTLVLVRWLGPRRARTWAQVIAAVLGASIYFCFQGQNLLPMEMRERFFGSLMRMFDQPVLTFIARAGRGEWPALLGLAGITLVFSTLTTRLLGRLFITGIQEAGGFKPKTRRSHAYRFARGLGRATFNKDFRLIARDPLLLSKVLPSVLYLVPLIFSVGRFGEAGVAGFLAAFSVMATITLSAQLTAVATAGEVGWDLILLSPAPIVRLRIAKIAAGMALPVALCAALNVAVVFYSRPGLALTALLTALVCSSASCWLQVGTVRASPRTDLIRSANPARSRGPAQIVTQLVFMFGGVGGVALAANGRWGLAAGALGIAGLTALLCFTLVEIKDWRTQPSAS